MNSAHREIGELDSTTALKRPKSGRSIASVVLGQLAAGEDAATTAARIADGPGSGMPGFGKTLDRQQIADLVQFLRTLPR